MDKFVIICGLAFIAFIVAMAYVETNREYALELRKVAALEAAAKNCSAIPPSYYKY